MNEKRKTFEIETTPSPAHGIIIAVTTRADRREYRRRCAPRDTVHLYIDIFNKCNNRYRADRRGTREREKSLIIDWDQAAAANGDGRSVAYPTGDYWWWYAPLLRYYYKRSEVNRGNAVYRRNTRICHAPDDACAAAAAAAVTLPDGAGQQLWRARSDPSVFEPLGGEETLPGSRRTTTLSRVGRRPGGRERKKEHTAGSWRVGRRDSRLLLLLRRRRRPTRAD